MTARHYDERPERREEKPSALRSALTAQRVVALALAALFAAWCAVNSKDVTVDYLVGEGTLPLFVALVVAAFIGLVVGYIAGRRRD